MEKVINFLKEEIRIIACLFIILLIIFVNIARVNADYMDEETNGNKKEQQLLDKIEAIKNAFPNQVDEYALYATLMHRGTLTDYIEESYDENFDKDEYNDLISDFANDISSLGGKIYQNVMSIWDALQSVIECAYCALTGVDYEGEECNYSDFQECVISGMIDRYVERVNAESEDSFVTVNDIKKPQTIDLLMAATIVMLDSSGWTGNYSDENYKKALAGEQLVGNMFDKNSMIQNAMSVIMNGVFCAVGQAGGFELTVDWFAPTQDYGSNENFGVDIHSIEGRYSRFFTMNQICQHGYIGGTYDHVKNPDLSTDKGKEEYQGKKDIVAEQIIDLAKRFRGEGGSLSDICLTGNTQSGDLSDMTPALCAQKFGAMAQADYSRTGVLASITLGQAWLESNCGKYTPPNSNNLFGIKCSSAWEGECSYTSTGEEVNGGHITITAGFRVYPSVEESINDHSKFLIENERYANAGFFDSTDYKKQAWALQKAGYATASDYASTLIYIIEANDFDKWDVKVNTTSSNSICGPVGNNGWAIRTVAPTPADQPFVDADGGNVGQCVWYAKGRAVEITEALRSAGKLSDEEADKIVNLLLQAWGNGGEIYDNTRGVFNGSSDIRQPKAGSYIVWKKSGSWGHVAIVEDVTDTTITLTEGWSTGGGSLSCSGDWSCVHFEGPNTYDLEDFYSSYGNNRGGGYVFSGYVYFLEPLN